MGVGDEGQKGEKKRQREKKVCPGQYQMSVRMVHSSDGANTARISGVPACSDAYACTVRVDADRQGSVEKQMANQTRQSAIKHTTGEGTPEQARKKTRLRHRDPGILTPLHKSGRVFQMIPQLWIQAQFKNISLYYLNKLRYYKSSLKCSLPLLFLAEKAAKAPIHYSYILSHTI